MEKALAARISQMILASLKPRNRDETAPDNIDKIQSRKRRLRGMKLRKRSMSRQAT